MKPKPQPSLFGSNLRALRQKHGWTTRRLAAEMSKHGVSVDNSAITRLERGQRKGHVQDRTAEAAAAALGTTAAYLRGYTTNPRRPK